MPNTKRAGQLSPRQMLAVGRLLEHALVAGDDGTIGEQTTHPDGTTYTRVKFRPGWNDQRVADENGCSRWAVKRVRQDAFGTLAKKGHVTSTSGVSNRRVRARDQRLDRLEAAVTLLAVCGLGHRLSIRALFDATGAPIPKMSLNTDTFRGVLEQLGLPYDEGGDRNDQILTALGRLADSKFAGLING